MAIIGELLVLLGVNNSALTAGLARSEAQLKGFSSNATTAMTGIRLAAIGVGTASVVAMGVAVNAAADFEEQMATINTIARQTPPELAKTGEAIRALAVATGSSLPDMTSAFYDLLSVGVPVGQAMEFLGNATTLSIGGISTVSQAVDAITSAVNAWSGALGANKLTMDDSGKVMDIFGKAIELGGLKAEDIAPALANVASLAASMNTPLEQVAATVALLTTRSLSASEATTSMNAAFTALQRVPPGMQLLQDKTGKAYEQIARTEGIHEAITQIVADAAKYSVGMVDVFGRTDALAYVLNTTGTSAKAYEATLASMYSSTGTAAGQAAIRSDTFNRQVSILSASVRDLAISVGIGLLPPLTAFIRQASGAVQAVGAWAKENPQLVSTILPIVAAIAALALILPPLVGLFALVFSPVGLVLLAVGVAIALVLTHMEELKRGIAIVQTAFVQFAIGISTNFQRGVLLVQTAINNVIAWFQALPGQVFAAFVGFGKAIVAGIMAGIGDIAKTVGDKLNTIPGVSLVGAVAGGAVDIGRELVPHAAGMYNVGADHAAFVHAGEMIIPKAAADQARAGVAGRSGGGPIQLVHHTHIHIDGREMTEVIENLLFNAASGSSSGFAGSPVTS